MIYGLLVLSLGCIKWKKNKIFAILSKVTRSQMIYSQPSQVKRVRVIKMPRELCSPSRPLTAPRGLHWTGTSFRISRPTELWSHGRANPSKLCKNKLHTYANCTSWETLSLEAWHLLFASSHREYFIDKGNQKLFCLVCYSAHFEYSALLCIINL